MGNTVSGFSSRPVLHSKFEGKSTVRTRSELSFEASAGLIGGVRLTGRAVSEATYEGPGAPIPAAIIVDHHIEPVATFPNDFDISSTQPAAAFLAGTAIGLATHLLLRASGPAVALAWANRLALRFAQPPPTNLGRVHRGPAAQNPHNIPTILVALATRFGLVPRNATAARRASRLSLARKPSA